MDIGLLATGLASATCLDCRNPWVSRMLFGAWVAGAVVAMASAGISTVVLTAALIDMVIALVSLAFFTRDTSRHDAQIVGALSLSIMPAHFIMAASQGAANWLLYVSCCNAVFVLQCLVAGGRLDGVGRGIADFWRRVRIVRSFRNGER